MNTSTRARRVLSTALAGIVLVAGGLFGSTSAQAVVVNPSSVPLPATMTMAALGDSITQGLMTCSGYSNCPANSWSTGTAAFSHASIIRSKGVALSAATNLSVTGAKVAALPGQANSVAAGTTYVTIEIGANDACTRTVATMTTPQAFQASVKTALATLRSKGVAQIFVASIPSLTQLYEVNKTNASARLTWGLLQLCQSMLANPTSTRPADVARRTQVQTQVGLFNAALQAECAALAADPANTTTACVYDQGAVASTVFQRSDISTKDYFHPSLSGQALLAAKTWAATQWVK